MSTIVSIEEWERVKRVGESEESEETQRLWEMAARILFGFAR